MTNEEYKELNEYLNEAFLYLYDNCKPFLDMFKFLCVLSDSCYSLLSKYDLKQNTHENKLTYKEVLDLARDIIKSINKEYLPKFDKLLTSGILDFSYENEYLESHYAYGKDLTLINIDRSFNYYDVQSLIHEFMHYINIGDECNNTTRLLTEFFSIYFEKYALDYLKKMEVPKEEVDYIGRLNNTYNLVSTFNSIISPLLAYYYFGSVDEDSLCMLYDYDIISNADFLEGIEESRMLLEYFRKVKKIYNITHFEHERNEKELRKCYGEHINTIFSYLFGTALTFYAIGKCDIKDIIYMNDHVNTPEYDNIFMCLDKMKIDILDPKFIDTVIKNIEKYLKDYLVEEKNHEKVHK